MAGSKTQSVVKERSMLNTTIKTETLERFKGYCKQIGMPMNLILEAFMEQFSNEEFVLKIGRSNKLNVDLSDRGKQ